MSRLNVQAIAALSAAEISNGSSTFELRDILRAWLLVTLKPLDPVGDEAVLRVTIQKMHNRLEMLPAREQRILMYHYGLSTLVFKTISETAAFFHLTEKYLRAIENHALAKLKDGMNDGKIV